MLSNEKKDHESFEIKRNRHYASTFKGVSAEFVLQDLMKYCNNIHSSFDPTNPHVTSFNEGKRAVVLHILAMLQYNEVELKTILDSKTYQTEYDESKEGSGSVMDDFARGLY